jgi:hypothetical protein
MNHDSPQISVAENFVKPSQKIDRKSITYGGSPGHLLLLQDGGHGVTPIGTEDFAYLFVLG